MTTDILQAADTVRSLARTFQSVIDLAEALETIGNVQAAEIDARARLGTLNSNIDKATAQLTSLNEQVDNALGRIDFIKGQGDLILADARAKGAIVIQEAKAQAQQMIADAQDLKASIDASVKESRGQLSEIGQAVFDKLAELDALNAKITNTKATLLALVQ